MNKKLLAILICSLFVSTVFSTHISAKTITIEEVGSVDLRDNKVLDGEDFDRWAVIIGISNYSNGSYLITCAENAKSLYDLLLLEKNGNWNTNNVKLLLDDSATRKNILDALDWLAENANEGDTILFYYDGHGSHFNDTDNDEPDGMDEVIIPYDFDYLEFPYEGINYITDDELDEKFNNISKKDVEGMFLIFSCCISGGLVDWKEDRTLSKDPSPSEIMNEFKSSNNFITELSKDVNGDDRVVLTSTLPKCAGLIVPPALFRNTISFGEGVCKAIKKGKTTAEEISHYAKRWWLSRPRVLIWILMLYTALLPMNVFLYVVCRCIILPVPMMKDEYPADHPLRARLSVI